MNNTLLQRLPLLVGLIFIIFMYKPSLIFKPNGKSRIYGLGYDNDGHKKTLYTFHFIILLFAFLLFKIV